LTQPIGREDPYPRHDILRGNIVLQKGDQPVAGRKGTSASPPQHGLDSLAGDVASVTGCVAPASAPVLLIGHS
jgi:hypothetical protein